MLLNHHFCGVVNLETKIHPSAIIDFGAKIDVGTSVWHFCHLMSTCVVGNNCSLGQNVFIGNNVIIGNGVKIQNNVSVYEGVIIEDDVFVGPSVVFTNVINPRSFVKRKNEFKKTIIQKGASIGANATILCGIEIGMFSMIGAAAVVTKNIPAYALMVGNPAKQIGWVSKNGHRLQFDETNTATCLHSKESYKLENSQVTIV